MYARSVKIGMSIDSKSLTKNCNFSDKLKFCFVFKSVSHSMSEVDLLPFTHNTLSVYFMELFVLYCRVIRLTNFCAPVSGCSFQGC